ncbi:MAG: hypothetical protein ACHQNE_09190, partial [Candidatus Kapaibacterium sp.]
MKASSIIFGGSRFASVPARRAPRRAAFSAIASLLALILCHDSLQAQTISYIIPDIGTPGMNTYIEIIGPATANNNFGYDGIYPNNAGDSIRVGCVNASDTTKVKFGPCVVSWNGKMIATQVFVMPGVTATSTDWRSGIKIPFHFTRKTFVSNADTFFIVQPQHFGTVSTVGVIGSGGAWGVRSKRGAMIVDSMILNGTGTYTIDTSDCDPSTTGNQGFLP